MRLFLTAIFFGFTAVASAECEPNHALGKRDNFTIPWSLDLYTEEDCKGRYQKFHGHESAIVLDLSHYGCIPLAKTMNDKVKSFVFTTPRAWWDLESRQSVAAIRVFRDVGCKNSLGSSKGKWIKKSTTSEGMKISSFRVSSRNNYDDDVV
ncbi:hypothetical protein BV22DRAFT_1028730 [Leucogyrophana mollusca]|uniref:Uncharacterized protein n=1 Tax=Leucogyrophana mollusca TaxID=85980 RepID=A0ACB8BZA5_9AGAM|nr:hypothetical protein BV22DRAFT_1028730 [Leucogyrophana mollusca]